MRKADIEMLQEHWDTTVNNPRIWCVKFSVNHINETGKGIEFSDVQVSAKSFAEVSNKFIMEAFQITNYKVLERFEDGYHLAEVTFRVGPEFTRTTRIRTLDQYSALHVLCTEVVKVEEIIDKSLSP